MYSLVAMVSPQASFCTREENGETRPRARGPPGEGACSRLTWSHVAVEAAAGDAVEQFDGRRVLPQSALELRRQVEHVEPRVNPGQVRQAGDPPVACPDDLKPGDLVLDVGGDAAGTGGCGGGRLVEAGGPGLRRGAPERRGALRARPGDCPEGAVGVLGLPGRHDHGMGADSGPPAFPARRRDDEDPAAAARYRRDRGPRARRARAAEAERLRPGRPHGVQRGRRPGGGPACPGRTPTCGASGQGEGPGAGWPTWRGPRSSP